MMTAADMEQTDFGSGPLAQAAMTAPAINLWLVDDNRRLRATLAELFTKADGIQCTGTFSSPNAVLSALASRVGPDVILLDVNMGEANGLDAIRPIKSLSRSTHVLMFTTFFDEQAESRALKSGASGFMLKSFPMDRVFNTIRETWTRPAPHPKRLPPGAAAPVPPLEPARLDYYASQLGAKEQVNRDRGARSRMLWIKKCLDRIRNVRN